MNQYTADIHYANGDGNLYALDKHLDEEDEHAEQLEEFQALTKKYFEDIEQALSHIKNHAESYESIDLDDEIKSRIAEFLPKTIDKKDIEMLALLQIANERIAELQKRLDERS